MKKITVLKVRYILKVLGGVAFRCKKHFGMPKLYVYAANA